MTDKLKNIIKEEVAKLPKEYQEAINAFDWVKVSEEIGKRSLLTENEINDLQVETLLILVGLEDLNLYANNVENNVGTSKDEANKIAEETLEKIFTPISNAITENIKRSGKSKNASAEQNLNFVLSGGNYAAFMENPPRLDKEGAGGGNSTKSPPRPLGTPPPQGGEERQDATIIPVFSIKEENLKGQNKI